MITVSRSTVIIAKKLKAAGIEALTCQVAYGSLQTVKWYRNSCVRVSTAPPTVNQNQLRDEAARNINRREATARTWYNNKQTTAATTSESDQERLQKAGTPRLYPPHKNVSSNVWTFVGFTKQMEQKDDTPICRKFLKKVPAPLSNKTNLRFHLQQNHPELYAQIQVKRTWLHWSTDWLLLIITI